MFEKSHFTGSLRNFKKNRNNTNKHCLVLVGSRKGFERDLHKYDV